VLVRLGLPRCQWSQILVNQHITSTSVWPNCGFVLQSLANPTSSQAALRLHRPHMVHHSGNKVVSRPHPCQRDRLVPPDRWAAILRETEFVVTHPFIAVMPPPDQGWQCLVGGKPTMLATALDQ
jgi:hypothetical protein